jgi:hypothetical protein
MAGIKNLVQQIRTGALELNVDTARELIHQVESDNVLSRTGELDLLQGLDQLAPKGSIHGRELLKEFVEGGENRFRSEKFNRTTSPWGMMWNNFARFNPFFSVPAPSYTRTDTRHPGNYSRELGEQSEINASRNLVGKDALAELAIQYDGAAKDVGLTRTRIEITDDVYQVYLDKVKAQPIDEYDPLGEVQAYLDDHYSRTQ